MVALLSLIDADIKIGLAESIIPHNFIIAPLSSGAYRVRSYRTKEKADDGPWPYALIKLLHVGKFAGVVFARPRAGNVKPDHTIRIRRREFHHHAEIIGRRAEFVPIELCASAFKVGEVVSWLQGDSLAEVPNGVVVVALGDVNSTATFIVGVVIPIELYRLVVVANRAIVVLFAVVRRAAKGMVGGLIRIEL